MVLINAHFITYSLICQHDRLNLYLKLQDHVITHQKSPWQQLTNRIWSRNISYRVEKVIVQLPRLLHGFNTDIQSSAIFLSL